MEGSESDSQESDGGKASVPDAVIVIRRNADEESRYREM